jgi:hypothetical protein
MIMNAVIDLANKSKQDYSTEDIWSKRKIWKEIASLSSSDSEEVHRQCNIKDSCLSCGFCHVTYCDPVSGKLADWLQCQGKKSLCNLEKCTGAQGKKTSVRGMLK